MRALLLGILLLGACSAAPEPELKAGEYVVPGETPTVGGARIRVDPPDAQIVMLGGCSANFVGYQVERGRLIVVNEEVTAETCFDGGPYADDVNNRVSELLNKSPRVTLTDRGFDLTPGAGGQPVSFVHLQKNAQSE